MTRFTASLVMERLYAAGLRDSRLRYTPNANMFIGWNWRLYLTELVIPVSEPELAADEAGRAVGWGNVPSVSAAPTAIIA